MYTTQSKVFAPTGFYCQLSINYKRCMQQDKQLQTESILVCTKNFGSLTVVSNLSTSRWKTIKNVD